MISIKNVTKTYDKDIFQNFSIDFNDNEVTALLGPSGCGKTTLLNLIIGTDKKFDGTITGVEGRKLTVVFQEDRLLNAFTILENLKVVNKDVEHCEKIAKSLGLGEELNKYPNQLSGGMKRRLALARAIAYNGEIVIMDEPFKGIDPALKRTVMAEVKEWVKDKTCIFVTHDMAEAMTSDRIVILKSNPVEIALDARPKNGFADFEKNYILKMESDL